MLDSYIIIGAVIAIVAIAKTFPPFKTVQGKLTIPLLVFAIAGALNVLNAAVFGGMALMIALKEGLTLGAVAGGLYSMGKDYLNKGNAESAKPPGTKV
jgi:hypothetical protein